MATKSSTTPVTGLARNQQMAERGNPSLMSTVKPVRERIVKPVPTSNQASSAANTSQKEVAPEESSSVSTKNRRRPRKLNKEVKNDIKPEPVKGRNETNVDPEAISELDELKSRVMGLENKVEQLYQSKNSNLSPRSPRRRGKNRKTSSSVSSPTPPKAASRPAEVVDEDANEMGNETEKQIADIEGELERARQALNSYRPRTERTRSLVGSEDGVEEIPRNATKRTGGHKQVTLSGSYRIPIPASVSVEDVESIKSGVNAAQNMARAFLGQRRAAAAAAAAAATTSRTESNSARLQQDASTHTQATERPISRGNSPAGEMDTDSTSGRQSWGDWVGGYSLAITRAVKNIEHEAAVEIPREARSLVFSPPARPMQSYSMASSSGFARKSGSGGTRPNAKVKLGSEEVRGLMS